MNTANDGESIHYRIGKRISIFWHSAEIEQLDRVKILIKPKPIMPTTKITVLSNGSLRIEGDFEIVDKEGDAYDLNGRTTVSLCRCGMSTNMPFCDGAHKGNFLHEAKAFALPPKKE